MADLDDVQTWRALWRDVRPDERAVAEARRRSRSLAIRKRRVRPLAVVAVVVLGMLITGAALGASGYEPFWREPTERRKLTTGVSHTREAVQRARQASVAKPEDTHEIPPVAPMTKDAPSKAERTSKLSVSESSSAELPGTEASRAESAGGEPSVRPGSAWQRAAEALADGDSSAADSAFDELTKSSDTKTRDAARLARAQLWVANGQSDRARSELTDLAAKGSTSLIRSRARGALRELAKRSKARGAGTN